VLGHVLALVPIFWRLALAILAATLAFTLAKPPNTVRFGVRAMLLVLAAAFAAAGILLVLDAIPSAQDMGLTAVSAIATAAFIAGLAIEELIGRDLRRLLGLEGAAAP
jgi:hypothetical protein